MSYTHRYFSIHNTWLLLFLVAAILLWAGMHIADAAQSPELEKKPLKEAETVQQSQAGVTQTTSKQRKEDPFAWLEEIRGERALAWVKEQNERTLKKLRKDPRYKRYYETALALKLNNSQIPGVYGRVHNGWVYDLLKDEAHPRGLWRRAKLESYLSAKPEWQPLLDIGAFVKAEGKLWELEFSVSKFYRSRCMVALTVRSGYEWREFDLEARGFVKNGFVLPERLSVWTFVWKDENTLFVPISGPPSALKEWSRGQSLSSAKEILRGDETKGISVVSYTDEAGKRLIIVEKYDRQSFASDKYKLKPDGQLVPIAVPLPTGVGVVGQYQGQLLLWTFGPGSVTMGGKTWQERTLLSIPVAELTNPTPAVQGVMECSSKETMQPYAEFQITRDGLLAISYENVRGRLSRYTFEAGRWKRERISLPDYGALRFAMYDPASVTAFANSGTAFVTYQSFLQPLSLYAVDVAARRATEVKKMSAQFDGSRYVTEQLWAVSKDGTQVPYFLVRPKSFKPNGKAPTLMHGYGSTGALMLPLYDGVRGRLWLDQGGLYVEANIRGGGELGPDWHVIGVNRRHTYEDFIAVAEDLIRRKITSPQHLGIRGHSMGGLLMGVTLNWRPELFRAAVIENPQDLDLTHPMKRPGSKELGYFNNPEELAFLEQISPYYNLRKRDDFPVPLLTTSTNDARNFVFGPRKYAAKLVSLNMPYFYYESPEGGHGFGVTPQQNALHDAMVYTYLAKRLME